MNRRSFVALAGASALTGLSTRALAAWPERLVRLVVPFPPAGAIDVVARLMVNRLQETWGQQVIIENKPGAGGNIGNELVARAEPNGYTLLLTQSGIVVNRFLYPNLGYDSVADFAPISLLALVPNVMVVPESSPARSVGEFIAYAKTRSLSYGSAGNGTSSHMCGELFKRRAGIDLTHVPYRGSPLLLNDLLAGRLDVTIDSVSGLLTHIQSGKLRALGVTSVKPLAVLPELRPLAELGLPGFEAAGLVAALAPARTPADLVARIQQDMAAVLLEPAIRKRLEDLGDQVVASAPDGLARYIQTEMEKWGPLIRDAKIKIDG
ncbi:MAG: tripartite tricarboxylate transporter substrate binding protein [Hyphomicrobiales bacterium]|nr:tripartite tricarboxylate transporter substrate binding protein [Hyphomicrobiales bacterium]